MKIKVLLVLSLAAVIFLGACGGSSNTNANRVNVNISTPMPMATATPLVANTDPMLKSNIESELKKKGFNNLTVDVTSTPATLRGTVPKGRMAEAIQTAQIANGGKPVKNEATEEK